MAKYGRDSEKHVFSYMDGVPVKISEQFKPPRKVGLPAGYQQRLAAETVSEEYDFGLENSVLEKISEWRKLRKAAVEKHKERIESLNALEQSESSPVKATRHSKLGSEPTSIPSTSVSPIPNNTSTYTNVPPKSTNFTTDNSSILTPVQIAQPTSAPEHSLATHFNFSDFEADTSSPFDNMELKTINEMEVLADVLQPLSHSPDTNKQKSLRSNTMNCKGDNTHNSIVNEDAHKNGLVAYSGSTYNTLQQTNDGNSTLSEKGISTYSYGSRNVIQGAYDYYPSQAWSVGDTNDPHQLPLESLNINNSSQCSFPTNMYSHSQAIPTQHISQAAQDDCYSSISKPVPMDNFNEYYCPTFPLPNQAADRSQSKSVPDIVHELDKELMCKEMDRRTGHSPRPNSFGSVGLENWKPWPDLDSPEHLRSCLKRSPPPHTAGTPSQTPKSALLNPFDGLSRSLQLLATHITEMGFALPRVARACEAIGSDDKKIVEYLLQVQSLEDENYRGDRAEQALIANDYDRDKAVIHLDAMEQLLGLGFKEEDIFEALVRFDSDRDKALDHLIS